MPIPVVETITATPEEGQDTVWVETDRPDTGYSGAINTIPSHSHGLGDVPDASAEGHTHVLSEVSGASSSTHTHDYAATNHLHDYAATGHTHAAKTVRIPHTFTISGDVLLPSGDTNYIPPFFISVPTGQTVKVVAAQTTMNSGTSVTVAIRRQPAAGGALVDISGLGAVPVGIGAGGATATSTANTLSDVDRLYCVVTAVSGNPKNMTVTVYLDYTV